MSKTVILLVVLLIAVANASLSAPAVNGVFNHMESQGEHDVPLGMDPLVVDASTQSKLDSISYIVHQKGGSELQVELRQQAIKYLSQAAEAAELANEIAKAKAHALSKEERKAEHATRAFKRAQNKCANAMEDLNDARESKHGVDAAEKRLDSACEAAKKARQDALEAQSTFRQSALKAAATAPAHVHVTRAKKLVAGTRKMLAAAKSGSASARRLEAKKLAKMEQAAEARLSRAAKNHEKSVENHQVISQRVDAAHKVRMKLEKTREKGDSELMNAMDFELETLKTQKLAMQKTVVSGAALHAAKKRVEFVAKKIERFDARRVALAAAAQMIHARKVGA